MTFDRGLVLAAFLARVRELFGLVDAAAALAGGTSPPVHDPAEPLPPDLAHPGPPDIR